MMKYLFGFLLIVGSLQAQTTNWLVTQDPNTNSGRMKPVKIMVVTNQIVSTNSVAGYAVTGTATNNGAAGEVVKTSAGGTINSGLITFPSVTLTSTNYTGSNTVFASAYVYVPIAQLSTTKTNGYVKVEASAANDTPSATVLFMRLRDTATNVVSHADIFMNTGGGNAHSPVMSVQLSDILTTASKTYILEVAAASSGTENWTNILTSTQIAAPATNAYFIKIYEQ